MRFELFTLDTINLQWGEVAISFFVFEKPNKFGAFFHIMRHPEGNWEFDFFWYGWFCETLKNLIS